MLSFHWKSNTIPGSETAMSTLITGVLIGVAAYLLFSTFLKVDVTIRDVSPIDDLCAEDSTTPIDFAFCVTHPELCR